LLNTLVDSIQHTCVQYGAKLVLVNLPNATFTGHVIEQGSMGLLNPYFLTHNMIDKMYLSVAIRNELPYIELTDHFKALNPKNNYFYIFDGHPNSNGYAEIANAIGTNLITSKLIAH
jgi:hypothetical protein